MAYEFIFDTGGGGGVISATDDTFFDVTFQDAEPGIKTSVKGIALNKSISADRPSISIGISGKALVGTLFDAKQAIKVSISLSAYGVSNSNKSNWIAWSKIGSADFTIDKVNDAGQRPMDWRGYVYQIKKLGDKNAIVYGSDGITLIYPVSDPPTFGFRNLQYFGIKNLSAVCGDDSIHYFIDKIGNLWSLSSDGFKKYGYKEFLGPLTNPIMLYDQVGKKVYICDSSAGYVFNDEALGGGFHNISGVIYLNSNQYFVTSGSIGQLAPEIQTHEIDFGLRGLKDIESLELGIDSANDLTAAIDYRYNKKDAFSTTSWVRVSPEGFVRIKISGVDFRIRVKSSAIGEFKLHYININLKYSDRRFKRSARSGG